MTSRYHGTKISGSQPIGSLISNDDGDGDENAKKSNRLR